MKVNDVISQLIIKEESDDVIYNIGPESKYIRGLYRSNNKNFDEFYLLGTDTNTTYQEEEREIDNVLTPVIIEETKYLRKNDANNYYILKKEKQIVRQNDIKLDTRDGVLSLCFNKEDDMKYDSEDKSIEQYNDPINAYVFKEKLYIMGDISHELQTLTYIDETGNIINVSQKEIISSVGWDDGIAKTNTIEAISNV